MKFAVSASLLSLLATGENVTSAGGCDCSWTQGGSQCGADDGSSCWSCCCAEGCDCSWTNGGASCGASDGSVCWRKCCACGDSPSPSPSPTPGPTPSPVPPASGAYCLKASDLTVAYGGGVALKDGGYSVNGNGGAASKASFNLLGGYVEFDVDVSNVRNGVNANFYAIAPQIGGDGYQPNEYCDGAENDSPWCIELDWVESNGACAGASTIHTVPGPGNNGCTAWGCRTHYTQSNTFHMRVEYGSDGSEKLIRNGVQLTDYSPQPDGATWATIKGEMQSKGVVLYGSEWTGWVPDEWCGGPNGGDLDASSYIVSNIVVSGSVVQGPEPTRCAFANTSVVV